mmetsp:Transcript_37831/g.89557  ORF Transcript_37831/g.89557 Transcript_37831/m.89557 type:complete len:275 (+) Transcript_37831:2-826(+)
MDLMEAPLLDKGVSAALAHTPSKLRWGENEETSSGAHAVPSPAHGSAGDGNTGGGAGQRSVRRPGPDAYARIAKASREASERASLEGSEATSNLGSGTIQKPTHHKAAGVPRQVDTMKPPTFYWPDKREGLVPGALRPLESLHPTPQQHRTRGDIPYEIAKGTLPNGPGPNFTVGPEWAPQRFPRSQWPPVDVRSASVSGGTIPAWGDKPSKPDSKVLKGSPAKLSKELGLSGRAPVQPEGGSQVVKSPRTAKSRSKTGISRWRGTPGPGRTRS